MTPNKKGLSTVITSLIIILLVLVAVGIVWVVIRNVISEGAEQVSLGKFMIDLKIKDVSVNPGDIDVKVKRNPGQGELTGIKFLIGDGINVQEFEEPTNIGELGETTFTLNYTGLVKEISIAPILKSGSGKDSVGNEIDKKVFSNKEIIENMGAVSWWKLDGNANDEIGNNDGTIIGANCNVDGKFGKACDFDGSSNYIDTGSDSSLKLTGDKTLVAWIKISADPFPPVSDNWEIMGSEIYQVSGFIWRVDGHNQKPIFRNDQSGTSTYRTANTALSNNVFYHVTVVVSSGQVTFYLDGNPDGGGSITPPVQATTNLMIGGNSNQKFDGTIDEPMIFNRALSEEQVKALYNLDLS
ncbi:MAG: LamG domain-containing protein [archaeon]